MVDLSIVHIYQRLCYQSVCSFNPLDQSSIFLWLFLSTYICWNVIPIKMNINKAFSYKTHFPYIYIYIYIYMHIYTYIIFYTYESWILLNQSRTSKHLAVPGPAERRPSVHRRAEDGTRDRDDMAIARVTRRFHGKVGEFGMGKLMKIDEHPWKSMKMNGNEIIVSWI